MRKYKNLKGKMSGNKIILNSNFQLETITIRNEYLKQLRDDIKKFTMDELLKSLEIIRKENSDKIIDYIRERVKLQVKTLQEMIDDYNKKDPEMFKDVDLSKIYTKIIGSKKHRKIVCSINFNISEYLMENKYFMEDTYTHFREKCGFYGYNKEKEIDDLLYCNIYGLLDDIIELNCFFIIN